MLNSPDSNQERLLEELTIPQAYSQDNSGTCQLRMS